MKIYDATPVDVSALNDLRFAIQEYEGLVRKQFKFGEIREKHHVLMEKLYTVISLRNKGIDEVIPDEDMEISFEQARSLGKVTLKVNINADVEDLIDKALEISDEYFKMITNR